MRMSIYGRKENYISMNKSDAPETMRGKRVGPNRDLGPKHGSNQQQNGQKEKK